MSFDVPARDPQEPFPLRGGAIRLEAAGIRHPGARARSEVLTPYRDVTHIAVSQRAMRLGSRRSVYTFPRQLFARPDDAQRLMRELIERIRSQPGGRAQLLRMAQIEVRAQTPRPLRATLLTVGVCVAIFLAQLVPEPSVVMEGIFRRSHVDFGEWWRLVTANLLHGSLPHLFLNGVGLVALGALVEWPLGSARVALVILASGFGAMAGGYLAGYEAALGASGIVAGLAGAVLYLELRVPDRLPVGWRVPRRLFLTLLALQVVLELVTAFTFPFIASAAHAGGFLTGIAVSALVVGDDLGRTPRPRLVRAADAALCVLVLLAVVQSSRALFADEEILTRRAAALLEIDYEAPDVLNYTAWMLVTECESLSRDQIETAVELAERAVEATQRRDPNVLDTLAEAQFVAGRPEEAVAIIDEAIAIAPRIRYFREQRRRFTGERDREDRPSPLDPDPLLPGRPEDDEPLITA